MSKRAVHTIAALLIAGAAGCSGAAWADPVKPGDQTGLGLMGKDTPELLKQAKENPYAPPAEPQCASVPQELAALNDLLGPDADQEGKGASAGDVVGGAVRSFIPHRNIFRIVTGANKKDAELNEAIKAGWARRGYLKGLAKTLDCTSPRMAAAEPPAVPAAAVAPEITSQPLPEPAGEAAPAPAPQETTPPSENVAAPALNPAPALGDPAPTPTAPAEQPPA